MKLFREILLAPGVFDSSNFDERDTRFVAERLREGFKVCRFIRTDDLGNWKKMAYEAAKGSIQNASIVKSLIKSKRLLECPGSGNDWFEIARSVHRRRPADGMLVDQLNDPPAGFPVPFARICDDSLPDWWGHDAPSAIISARSRSLRNLLAPLLLHSREVHLINKYLSPDRQDLIEAVRDLLGATNQNSFRPAVYLHLSSQVLSKFSSEPSFASTVRAMFEAFGLRSQLFCCIWKSRSLPNRQLERIFLTDLGGCNLHHSLEMNDEKATAEVSLLSGPDAARYRREFFPECNASEALIEIVKLT